MKHHIDQNILRNDVDNVVTISWRICHLYVTCTYMSFNRIHNQMDLSDTYAKSREIVIKT